MKSLRGVLSWAMLSLSAVSCSTTQTNTQADLQSTCRKFVQGFYDWYVPNALKDNGVPASDLALKQRSSVFSPDLLGMLKEDSVEQSKAQGDIVGLDFDPFLNTQDPSSNYTVGNVTQEGDSCRAEILSAVSDRGSSAPVVMPELTLKDGEWVFVNFHYGKSDRSEDENLISTLKRLRQNRQPDSK